MSSGIEELAVVCFCSLAVLGIGAALFLLFRTLQATSAASRVGRQLGFEKLSARAGRAREWWGGKVDRRRVAMRAVGRRTGLSTQATGSRHTMEFCIIVEVRLSQLTNISIATIAEASPEAPFDESFAVEDDGQLTDRARQALLHFANLGYESRLTRSGKILQSGRLRMTAFGSPKLFSYNLPEILPGATSVLVMCHPEANLRADEVERLLADLSELAEVLEQELGAIGRVAPGPKIEGQKP